jgi:Cd2+/Zn2+-exporting ATPase
MIEQLNAASLGATLISQNDGDEDTPAPGVWELVRTHAEKVHVALVWVLFFVGVCLSDELARDVVLVVSTGIGALPILRKAFQAAVRLVVDMSALMSLAIAGAVGSAEYHEAALVVCLFLSAEIVEHLTMARVARALNAVMHLSVKRTAMRVNDGKQVLVTELKVGDDIALRPGDECPVDGEVSSGGGSVSEAALTGEARPVEKARGSTMTSGCVVLNGYIEVRLTALPKDSMHEKIKEQVEEAQAQKARAQVAVDKFAKYWTPLILLAVAVLLVVMPLATDTPFVEWFDRALVLLVLACPCALVLAAPVPTTCAIAAAAQHQVLIKRADVVEQLASVSVLGVDKTGTLTSGEFAVVAVEEPLLPAPEPANAPRETPLRLAAALEAKSAHPMAAAVVSRAVGCAASAYEGGGLPAVRKFKNVEGVGVKGEVDAGGGCFVPVIAGNARVLATAEASEADRECFDVFLDKHMDDTNIAVIVDGSLALMIALNDTIRSDAKGAVDRLRGLGCTITMLTGDTECAARPVAAALGIEAYKSSMLPKDKHKWILDEEAKKVRSLMLGDGINDSNALGAATVGVAMGETSMALAARTADAVIMSDKLSRLPQTIQICRYAHRLVWLNIGLAATVKLAAVGLALADELELWMAVVVDVGSLLLVVLIGATVLAKKRVWDDSNLMVGNEESD